MLVLVFAHLVVRRLVVCLDCGVLGIRLDLEIPLALAEILAKGIPHPAMVETLARGNLALGSFDWVDYIPCILQVIEETIVVRQILLVVD